MGYWPCGATKVLSVVKFHPSEFPTWISATETVPSFSSKSKGPNCLIKNLFEMDTLPHLKIYSKLPVRRQGNRSVLHEGMEGTHEVNDERKACLDQKLCPPLPEEAQEGKGGSADGVYRDDGIQPLLWGLFASPPGQADLVEPKVVAVGDIRKKAGGQRARKYDQKVVVALKIIWEILDYLCGKRLVAILPEVVPILERHGELKVDASTRERLIQISAATIDRLLAPERRKHQLKGRSGTKPGTLLKHQIRSSVSPTGKRTVPVLWKWTWWAMREA